MVAYVIIEMMGRQLRFSRGFFYLILTVYRCLLSPYGIHCFPMFSLLLSVFIVFLAVFWPVLAAPCAHVSCLLSASFCLLILALRTVHSLLVVSLDFVFIMIVFVDRTFSVC